MPPLKRRISAPRAHVQLQADGAQRFSRSRYRDRRVCGRAGAPALFGEALAAARRAMALATERFDRGLTDSLNVIDAQRQEYEIEQQYVAAQQSAAAQFVMLYKSLGGGWEEYQSIPPVPPPLPAVAAAFKRLWAPQAAP